MTVETTCEVVALYVKIYGSVDTPEERISSFGEMSESSEIINHVDLIL